MEEKRNKPDYAAIIREYRMYGGSGSMKRFCEENDYNYSNVNRYYRKHFWDRYSRPKTDSSPVRLDVVPDGPLPDDNHPGIKSDQKIQRFSVRFAVNQQQVRFHVALPIASPIANQRMIPKRRWQRQILHQTIQHVRKQFSQISPVPWNDGNLLEVFLEGG